VMRITTYYYLYDGVLRDVASFELSWDATGRF
jgi:hypothetical protein